MSNADSAEEEAAQWFVRLRSGRSGRGDQARFLRWLNADPSHADAYARYEALWSDIGRASGEPELVAIRREALALAPAVKQWPLWKGALIAATLVIGFVGSFVMLNQGSVPPLGRAEPTLAATADGVRTLQTAVGERSAVTLEDGSVIEINTDSLVHVDYSADRRDVRLVRGQALFQVARNLDRPFVVEAAGERITALGTAFDVRVHQSGVEVTLLEGKVAVEPAILPPGGNAARRTLNPGEKLIARASSPAVILPANVQREVSWRTGRLVFSDEPLGKVIEEVNRYSTSKIVVGDPTLAELRVSGVFRVGSTTSFVTALDSAFPVAAEFRGRDVVLRWE